MGKRNDEFDNSLRIIDFHVDFQIGLFIEAGSGCPQTLEGGQWIWPG